MAQNGFRTEQPYDDTHRFAPAPVGPVKTAQVRPTAPGPVPPHIMENVAFRSGLPGGLPTPAQATGQTPVGPQQQSQQGYRNAGPVAVDPLTEILDSIGGGLKEFLDSIFGAGDPDPIKGPPQGGYAVDPYKPLPAGSQLAPVSNSTKTRTTSPTLDPAFLTPDSMGASGSTSPNSPNLPTPPQGVTPQMPSPQSGRSQTPPEAQGFDLGSVFTTIDPFGANSSSFGGEASSAPDIFQAFPNGGYGREGFAR